MPNSFSCPQCKRLLPPSGEVAVGDRVFPVYQCEHCTREVLVLGTRVPAALTFCVDTHGRAFDPASPDDILRN